MKMIYTRAELAKLTEEELKGMMYLSTENALMSYGDIATIHKTCIKSKTGEQFDGNEQTIEAIHQKHMRYNLIQSTLKASEEDAKSKEAFRNEINSAVAAQVLALESSYEESKNSLDSLIHLMTKKLSSSLATMHAKLDTTLVEYDNTLKQFDTFNTSAYDIRMGKVDRIIDSFNQLLDK